MAMPVAARIPLVAGGLGLALTVLNQLTAPAADPSLQRAGVLASILAVVLMLVGLLWTRITPVPPERATLQGEEGLQLAAELSEGLQRELAWGSALLLTATPAATLLLVWRGRVLLRRGLLPAVANGTAIDGTANDGTAISTGAICRRALETGRPISLVDLRLYPGRAEFETLLPGLPSVLVQPFGEQGLLLLGGWSARCFSRSDLVWVEGWTQRLTVEWVRELDAAEALAAEPSGVEPAAG